MTLILRIENFDQLPDGGPVELRVDQQTVEIGRTEGANWILPDANRFISGRHCEVRHEGSSYLLYDVSRNGTRVNGQIDRMKSPHTIHNGDRIQIGDYLIVAHLDEAQAADDGSKPSAFDVAGHVDDVWGFSGPTPEPIDKRSFRDSVNPGRRVPDFSHERAVLPTPIELAVDPSGSASPFGSGIAQPQAPFEHAVLDHSRFGGSAPGSDPFGVGNAVGDNLQQTPAASAPAGRGQVPQVNPGASPISSHQPQAQPGAAPTPVSSMPPAHAHVRAQQRAQTTDESLVLRMIAQSAGLPDDAFLERDVAEVAGDIGQSLKLVADELAILLRARAAAKKMTRNPERTMIGAQDNNPLKFIPSTSEALEIMYAKQRAGYLDASGTIRSSFEDLKRHEYATYSAMQKALLELVRDIEPDAVEARVQGSAIGSRKAKAWDAYRERWHAYTEPNENGVLDVFLKYFSKAYEAASREKK